MKIDSGSITRMKSSPRTRVLPDDRFLPGQGPGQEGHRHDGGRGAENRGPGRPGGPRDQADQGDRHRADDGNEDREEGDGFLAHGWRRKYIHRNPLSQEFSTGFRHVFHRDLNGSGARADERPQGEFPFRKSRRRAGPDAVREIPFDFFRGKRLNGENLETKGRTHEPRNP